MSYNIRILSYLSPCCGVLAARFSNLTNFECSHRRDAVTHTHYIFHNISIGPHHATRKISNLYIENKYHHLTLQNKSRLLLNKGVVHSANKRISPSGHNLLDNLQVSKERPVIKKQNPAFLGYIWNQQHMLEQPLQAHNYGRKKIGRYAFRLFSYQLHIKLVWRSYKLHINTPDEIRMKY